MSELRVGVLSADLLRLGEELDTIASVGADQLHIDVMDGVFCPGITVGAPFVSALPDSFGKDVHLMVDDPLRAIDAFVAAGADTITFHVELTRHPHRVLQELGAHGIQRGVALNPGTPVDVVKPLLDDMDLLLILGVNPGWSGQSFIEATTGRLRSARRLLEGRDILLGIDGGITKENVRRIASEPVDVVVAGSAVFDGSDLTESARHMLQTVHGEG